MQNNRNPQDIPPELWTIIIVGSAVFLVLLLIGLIVTFFYCRTMKTALERCAPENRILQPNMVWLVFIPCVGMIFQFLIAIQVPDSLKKEFDDRREGDGSDYGKMVGLTSLILILIGSVLGVVPIISLCAPLVDIAGLVMFIIFWVKIAGYSAMLASGESGSRPRREREFDDRDE